MNMTNGLLHKGYAGSTEVSHEDGCLHGRVLFIDDLITYEADTVPELQAAFKEAVDRYLEHCKAIGKSSAKPCSGTFNVRIGEVLHRRAAVAAAVAGQSLNEFVARAIEATLEGGAPGEPRKQVNIYRASQGPQGGYQPVANLSSTYGVLKWGTYDFADQ